MFGDPRHKVSAPTRHTHSVAIRTRSGDTLISQLDLPHVGPGPTKYNLSTLPTSHGMLPMSPSAMLQGGPEPGFGAQTRTCHDPPNVLWLLAKDGSSAYKKELQPTPRVLSSPMCAPPPLLPLRCARGRRRQ